MADERPDAAFDTDAIIEVFGHLAKREETWNELMTEHGLDPVKMRRAFHDIFEKGDGRIQTAVQAFVLGLQFGAMRLDPIEFKPEEMDTCGCFACVIRRQMEGQAKAEPEEEER